MNKEYTTNAGLLLHITESSQWKNWNHLFCCKVSFLSGPRWLPIYKVQVRVRIRFSCICVTQKNFHKTWQICCEWKTNLYQRSHSINPFSKIYLCIFLHVFLNVGHNPVRNPYKHYVCNLWIYAQDISAMSGEFWLIMVNQAAMRWSVRLYINGELYRCNHEDYSLCRIIIIKIHKVRSPRTKDIAQLYYVYTQGRQCDKKSIT